MLPKSNTKIGTRAGTLCSVLVALGASVSAHGSEIAVVGAIEQIDCAQKSVRVLGIDFIAADAATEGSICSAGLPSELIYASVVGQAADNRAAKIMKFSIISRGAYVPGASSVYLRGAITGSNPHTGHVALSGAIVSGVDASSVSGVVEILGTQPLLGGTVLAIPIRSGGEINVPSYEMTIRSSAGSGAFSLTGTRTLSSAHSGKLSSAGSGKLSSAGSGKLSSAGSGKLSSAGSGKLSSAGSGKLSSAGSGKLSSAGSGKLSSAGSGKLSSAGSGKLSSAGSGKLSSAGSGKLSSAGSGKLSSAGSGKLSSAGSGVALQ
jgi:hypothetical protein